MYGFHWLWENIRIRNGPGQFISWAVVIAEGQPPEQNGSPIVREIRTGEGLDGEMK